jgi:D-alanyl-D-alanine carboxypeptidase
MSAHDLAIVSREVFKDQTLYEIMSQTEATALDASGQLSHPLGHTHQLLYTDETALAGKTGTTEGAGQVLVTLFERQDNSGTPRKIIVVVMGSEDRYADTEKIIDWVFENYNWQQISLHEES